MIFVLPTQIGCSPSTVAYAITAPLFIQHAISIKVLYEEKIDVCNDN